MHVDQEDSIFYWLFEVWWSVFGHRQTVFCGFEQSKRGSVFIVSHLEACWEMMSDWEDNESEVTEVSS